MHRPAHPPRRDDGRPLAVAVVVAAVLATVLAAVLDAAVVPAHRATVALEPGWVAGIPGLALAVPGAVLLRRRPRHPVAWVLCAAGTWWALDGLAASWLAFATQHTPPLPGASPAFWVYQRLGAGLLLALPLVLLLYPDGRLPAGRWRVASLLSLATTALLPLVLVVVPARVAQDVAGGPVPEPFRTLNLDLTTMTGPAETWTPLLATAQALVPVSLLVPFAVVVRRYRHARGQARTRMRWLLWAAVVDVLVMLGTQVLPDPLGSVGLSVAVAVTGAAVAAGITRPDVLDVDRLLGGTVVYAALAAAVVAVDVAVVAAAGALLGERLAERDAALLALLVVTAGYAPLRHRMWRLVRRLVLGEREDPYAVVSGLAERLEASDDPEDQLLAVARSAAEAFRSPYVGVEVDRVGGERVLAEHGHRPDDVQVLPIAYRGEQVGRLLLPRRGPRASLTGRDERLLGDVVRQAAAAARTSHLARELQHSRELLVAAREEERRRLRRDLHDGLGPVLGSVVLRLDAVRNLSGSDPGRADEVLRLARDDVAGALSDVRRLVHDLRPPALDDVGLVGAIRQQADRLQAPGLRVDVEADAPPELPAAVEVAAYRIASEALANVARHARASTCTVRLRAQHGRLVVEVADDGVGIDPAAAAGVGLVSLRERAFELGGTCEVTCPSGGGTLVRAVLPTGVPERAMEGAMEGARG